MVFLKYQKIPNMILPMNNNIILIGMMGSGKSTLGKELSRMYNLNFIDTDEAIEEQACLSIGEIFKIHGEKYFRNLEEAYLDQLDVKNHIISSGGGIILSADNRKRLKVIGHVVYLKTSVDVLYKRLNKDLKSRPLLDQASLKDKLNTLIMARQELYENTADDIVNTDEMTEKEVIYALKKILKKIGYKL